MRDYVNEDFEPEEAGPEPLKLYCHDCNLVWRAEEEGWQCPECDNDPEIPANVELQKDGSIVAFPETNSGDVGCGPDVPSAVDNLYKNASGRVKGEEK